MKISTLSAPIIHERKPDYDDARFAAIDSAFDQLIAEIDGEIVDAFIYSNIPVLKFVAPVLDILIVDGVVVIIEEARAIPIPLPKGMSRQQITKLLLDAVRKGG